MFLISSLRAPPQAFGSPLEDAERRDLTINALFYNLRTRQIEDCTGLGLSDLGLLPSTSPSTSPDSPPTYKRMIRTPLPPFKTFRDDPLRVVRAVRFAARFGREFGLDAGLVEAIQREEIRVRLLVPLSSVDDDDLQDGPSLTALSDLTDAQQALLDPKKISRERVGTELDKMLLGPSFPPPYVLPSFLLTLTRNCRSRPAIRL